MVTLSFRGPRSNTTFWYPQEECWGRRWTHSSDHVHHRRSWPLAHGIRSRNQQNTGTLNFSNLMKAEWGIHLGRFPKPGFEGSSSHLPAPSGVQPQAHPSYLLMHCNMNCRHQYTLPLPRVLLRKIPDIVISAISVGLAKKSIQGFPIICFNITRKMIVKPNKVSNSLTPSAL